jgi:hypothetical protein
VSDEQPISGPAEVIRAIEAVGQAWRGDWSDFDGRTLRHQLNELCGLMESALAGEDVKEAVAGFYASTSICPQCHGWTEHCQHTAGAA